MKKGKATMIFTIGIACFALTLVMFMQFKIVNETDITSIETMREDELRTELANWKQKYDEAKLHSKEVEEKIEEYKEKKENNIETSGLVKEELEQANILLGKTDLVGEGIEITIREMQEEDYTRIKDSDLITIVNALKYAGAEAISINEERITNMTDIVDIGSSFIKINGQRILAPYVIKVIGNKTFLESSLIGNGGAAEQLKKMGHEVQITQNNNVMVKKYNGNINYKYISD